MTNIRKVFRSEAQEKELKKAKLRSEHLAAKTIELDTNLKKGYITKEIYEKGMKQIADLKKAL